MAGSDKTLPPLFITACIMLAIGIMGLGSLFFLPLSSKIFEGLFYIFVGTVVFGLGEIFNHRKTASIATGTAYTPVSSMGDRKRNSCSLGNLCDIGGILLFFFGLSDLIISR